MLIQTKMAPVRTRTSFLSSVTGDQFELYDRWPTFDLPTLGATGFALGTHVDQGLLGLINSAKCPTAATPCSGCAGLPALWRTEDFRKPGSVNPLSRVWYDLLRGHSGRPFVSTSSPTSIANDWDRLWELLLSVRVTSHPFTLRSSGIAKVPRGYAIALKRNCDLGALALCGGPNPPACLPMDQHPGEQGLTLVVVDVVGLD